MNNTFPELYWFSDHDLIVRLPQASPQHWASYVVRVKPVAEQSVRFSAFARVKDPGNLPPEIVRASGAFAGECALYLAAGEQYSKISESVAKLEIGHRELVVLRRAFRESCSEELNKSGKELEIARKGFGVAFSRFDEAHHAQVKARKEYRRVLSGHMNALAAQYLREYPENAKLFDHRAGSLIFNPITR